MLIIVAIEAGITDVYTLSSMFALMACCQVAAAFSKAPLGSPLGSSIAVTHALDPHLAQQLTL